MTKSKPLTDKASSSKQSDRPQERGDSGTLGGTRSKRTPPDGIPELMPGVDPQQTPGVDHSPAERDRS